MDRASMKIACPKCASQVEVEPRLSRDDTVTCPSCGSVIRLRSDGPTPHQAETRPMATPGVSTVARLLPSAEPPERLGRYAIRGTVGRGGMGVVYRAFDTDLEREVALKVLPGTAAAHAEDVQRFVHEARRLAGLSHPNLVRVLDAGRHEGIYYFAMELIQGQNLRAWVQARQPELPSLLAVVAGVADGVEAAHAIQLLHRDLKPANILVTDDGVPKVMDFGLAKKLDAGDDMTVSGALLGTPDYMSPEQAGSQELDLRSDVFSLGVILYEMTTGVRPFFAGSLHVTIHRILTEDPVPPRAVQPALPREVEAIILKCMERPRERRYASVGALAADIRRYLNHEPVHARPISVLTRGRKFVRRHRVLAGAVGAVGMALLIGLFGALAAWSRAAAARKRAERAEARVRAALDRAEYEGYALKIALAQSRMADDAFDQANQLLADCPPGLRHWEWGRLVRRAQLDERTLSGFTDIVNGIAVAPDGSALLTTGWGKTAKVLDPRTGEERLALFGHTDTVTAVAWSPDGSKLATAGRDGTARLCSSESGRLLAVLKGHEAGVTSIRFSPDSTRVLTASLDKIAILWDAATGKALTHLGPHAAGLSDAAFVHGRDAVVTGCANGRAVLWDLTELRRARIFEAHRGPLTALDVSPDGRQLITAGYDKRLRLWDVDKGACLKSLGGHKGPVFSVAFSADGTRALTGSADRVARLWLLADGSVLRAFRGHEREVFAARFFPSGERIATGSEDFTLRVWQVGEDRGVTDFPVDAGPALSLAFSADGTRVLLVSSNGTASLRKARTGALVRTFGGKNPARSAALAPDGATLLTGGEDGCVRVWDAASGELLDALPPSGEAGTEAVTALAYAPDGARFAWGTSPHDPRTAAGAGSITLVRAEGAAVERTLRNAGDGVESLAFFPDGRRLVSGSVLYNANGENRGRADIWDADTGERLVRLTGPDEHMLDAAVSADGTQVATASIDWDVPGRHNDFFVKLWDAMTGQLAHRLAGHLLAPRGAAFFPDGRRVVSAGIDRAVIVWDAHHGRELLRLRHVSQPANDVAVSPDGASVAVAFADGRVRVFHAAPWEPAPRDDAAFPDAEIEEQR